MNRVPTMILSAGLATRLRPLSSWRAKALVPIGDRPALALMLDQVRAAGGSPIVINAHHRAGDLRAFAASEAPDLAVSEERELLGTAGGVRHAEAALGAGDVLVWTGDIVLVTAPTLDLAALLLDHFAAVGGARDATLVVRPGPCGTGNVGTDGDGRIVRLRTESVRSGETRGGEFIPIHVVGSAARAALPALGCLVGDVYLPLLRRGVTLRAFFADVPWHDIGTVMAYRDANLAWLSARNEPFFCAPDAHVAGGVSLTASVVGAGATVDGGGALERCVVWPGATAHAPLADAVVTPHGTAYLTPRSGE